ncbi:hypothetical protein [Mycobacterium shigaense]|uniref:Uncharacterized protein n=1 Tax=Mycobacterium shigaense TaxID=722731 RepID=A0A1Z4EPH5_9MYCO|nr:hypothetical protein [Mycobacterium shigaense]MEA1122622.1 hypothetical protein [Mycobacterium shigaense]PRI14960.1 hypothetical protein B2J96_10860 [Mycobacterium shigaense]BAX94776.1 hypothetical protein MSG_04663 [Mycobacterium shigaense]
MFTLLVSWLLVACIPGLLMLAALGLGRLETELARESVTAADVDEFLEHAQAVDVRTLAREGITEALEYLHQREAQQLAAAAVSRALTGRHHAESMFAIDLTDPYTGRLMPARIHAHSSAKRQYGATRHVNRV